MFDFASASNTVQNALDNALLYTAAQFKVDDMLYTRRGPVSGSRATARRRIWSSRSNWASSLTSARCRAFRRASCKAVFDQVTTSRENRNKALNDAHSYENQVLNQSGAQATSITNDAAAASAQLRQIHHGRGETVRRPAAAIPDQFEPVRAA